MIHYYLSSSNKDSFIQIAKDYVLRIKKSNKRFLIAKEEKSIDSKKENLLDFSYSLSGHITSNDVYTQLANIKHIGFEVTDSCNLECTYCIYGKFYSNHDNRTNKKIDVRKAKLLIDFLVEKLNSPANISPVNDVFISFYGGEPLLNMDFIKEIVSYTQQIHNHHIRIKYMMTTNAVYLKKYFSFLFEYNFIITISLDGTKENDLYRKLLNGKSSFEIVYENIKYIQRNYSDYFKNNIMFNSVIHNLNNKHDVFSFFYHEFEKIPRFSSMNPTGVKAGLEKDFDNLIRPKPSVKDEKLDLSMLQVLDLKSDRLSQLQDFIFYYSGNIFDNYNELLVRREGIEHLPTATCIPFSKRIFMTVNNKIYPCERIGHQFVLGEVTDKEVKIDCEYIAEKYNTYYDSVRKQCVGCYHKRYCTQCMFDIRGLGGNPICDQIGNKQTFNEYIQINMKILSGKPELYKRIMEEIIIIK